MNKKHCLMLAILLPLSFLLSNNALAFFCTPESGGSWSITPPLLKKDTNDRVHLFNTSGNLTCEGAPYDNLRVFSSSIDSRLVDHGFAGVLNIGGTRFDMPATGIYIWPYANNSAAPTGNGSAPVNVIFELRRSTVGAWGTALTLPAGTVLATLTAEQRSGQSWGWHRTWTITANTPVVFPAYTCNVTTPDNTTVTLPNVEWSDLEANGAGRYNGTHAEFSIALACNELATVSLSLNGTMMSGTDDVLVNQDRSEPVNSNVGIQILPAGSNIPVKFGTQEQAVIDFASANETFNYEAYYYYRGGFMKPGRIRATMTYTFSYR